MQPDPAAKDVDRFAGTIADPADAPVLAAAAAADVDALVTGSIRRFTARVASEARLHILSPAQALQQFLEAKV